MKILLLLTAIVSSPLLAKDIHAIGKFERFEFEFRAKTLSELNTECLDFTREQRIAHIDDIYVSFNGHKRLHLHNRDGMWHYPVHICNELTSTANQIDLSPPVPSEFQIVEALIGRKSFQFSGSNDAEVFNECIGDLEKLTDFETDYMRFRLNNGRWHDLTNGDGWWRGAQKICTLIDKVLYQRRSPL